MFHVSACMQHTFKKIIHARQIIVISSVAICIRYVPLLSGTSIVFQVVSLFALLARSPDTYSTIYN